MIADSIAETLLKRFLTGISIINVHPRESLIIQVQRNKQMDISPPAQSSSTFVSTSGQFSRQGIDDAKPEHLEKVVEGFAAVLFPRAVGAPSAQPSFFDAESEECGAENQSVFYNPAQVVNRDLSICAIEAFSRQRPKEARRRGGTTDGITVLEALSASGLRAIRYWKEITGLKYVIANDLDPDAVECIRRNAAYNGVPVFEPSLQSNMPEEAKAAGGGLIPNCDNAIYLMQRLAVDPLQLKGSRMALLPPAGTSDAPRALIQQELVDVVDLDPYGTASPFLDSAFAAIKEGGLMLVTSTDSPILCGNYPDTCHAKYNSIMMKPAACHEVAVRILLAAAERAANKHKKYIVPLISLHIDFYVRVFFRVYTQAAESKLAVGKLAHVAQCTRCPSFWISPIGRVRAARKEIAKAKKGEKRNRGESDASVAPDEQESVKRPTASYPQTPSREKPFKSSCPTIESWLPDSHNHCPVCGGHISIGGPIYAAPTQNVEFLETLLQVVDERHSEGRLTATDRVRGLILAARDELPDTPLFYALPDISSFVKARCPPTPIFVGALARLGYRFSQVHCHRSGIKTDCPPDVLIRAMLAFKAKSDSEDAAASTEAGSSAKSAETTEATTPCLPSMLPMEGLLFEYDKQFDFRSAATGVVKFVPNAPNWGPKRRHQGIARDEEEASA